jgi:hypothetical protein
LALDFKSQRGGDHDRNGVGQDAILNELRALARRLAIGRSPAQNLGPLRRDGFQPWFASRQKR